jgi:hypothetical protein
MLWIPPFAKAAKDGAPVVLLQPGAGEPNQAQSIGIRGTLVLLQPEHGLALFFGALLLSPTELLGSGNSRSAFG